jgi:hypothetical protein
MSKDLKIAYCGDVCTECPRYIATQNKDNAEFVKIAELWFRLGFRERIVSAGELKCNGCSKDLECAHLINTCEHLKDKYNCGECDLFPCDKLNAAFQKSEKINKLCKAKCTALEFEKLSRAFLMKRQILSEINETYLQTKKR